MKRVSFEDMGCSVAQALEQVGEWWTPLIIRDALLGVRRFDEFQERLGISRNILATRLEKLVADGILERRRYRDNPPRDEYVLTEKGKDLWRVVTVLRQWGDRWIVGEGNGAVDLFHVPCGHTTHAVLTCSECGEELRRGDVRAIDGPSATTPDDSLIVHH